jgi:hypothetical protein
VTTARRDDGGSGNGRGSGRGWNDDKVLFRRAVFGPEVDGQDDSVDVDGTEGRETLPLAHRKTGPRMLKRRKAHFGSSRLRFLSNARSLMIGQGEIAPVVKRRVQ